MVHGKIGEDRSRCPRRYPYAVCASVRLELEVQTVSRHRRSLPDPSRRRAPELGDVGDAAHPRDFERDPFVRLPADDRQVAPGAPWVDLPPRELRGEGAIRLRPDFVEGEDLLRAVSRPSPSTAERGREFSRLQALRWCGLMGARADETAEHGKTECLLQSAGPR